MKKVMAMTMVAVVALTGCNAMKDFGKDIKRTGKTINQDMQKTKSSQ